MSKIEKEEQVKPPPMIDLYEKLIKTRFTIKKYI